LPTVLPEAECCEIRGYRRRIRNGTDGHNFTWRQQVGGSAIEASKIAGHGDLEMTGDYPFVTAERQNELTRRIQQKLAQAACTAAPPKPASADVPPNVAGTALATTLVQ
jgi:hypothetical protein